MTMRRPTRLACSVFLLVCLGMAEAAAAGQDPERAASAPVVEAAAAVPAAPAAGFKWAANFDAGWGTFGFANTLFEQPREGGEDEVRDRWFEGYVKPAFSAGYDFAAAGRFWGKVSAVGERTYGDLPSELGLAVSSFDVEDLAVGWKSGTALGRFKEDALQLTVGRAPYTIGNGLLVWDGAAEGGSRGGYWTNGRKAWKMAAIGRFSPNAHTIEGFYLEKRADQDRTGDIRLAKPALSQLSYSPECASKNLPGVAARWARAELNCRPHAYQACALTT